jgi:hypothetical protein
MLSLPSACLSPFAVLLDEYDGINKVVVLGNVGVSLADAYL